MLVPRSRPPNLWLPIGTVDPTAQPVEYAVMGV